MIGPVAFAYTTHTAAVVRHFVKQVVDESIGLDTNSPALALRRYVLRSNFKMDASNAGISMLYKEKLDGKRK